MSVTARSYLPWLKALFIVDAAVPSTWLLINLVVQFSV